MVYFVSIRESDVEKRGKGPINNTDGGKGFLFRNRKPAEGRAVRFEGCGRDACSGTRCRTNMTL